MAVAHQADRLLVGMVDRVVLVTVVMLPLGELVTNQPVLVVEQVTGMTVAMVLVAHITAVAVVAQVQQVLMVIRPPLLVVLVVLVNYLLGLRLMEQHQQM